MAYKRRLVITLIIQSASRMVPLMMELSVRVFAREPKHFIVRSPSFVLVSSLDPSQ